MSEENTPSRAQPVLVSNDQCEAGGAGAFTRLGVIVAAIRLGTDPGFKGGGLSFSENGARDLADDLSAVLSQHADLLQALMERVNGCVPCHGKGWSKTISQGFGRPYAEGPCPTCAKARAAIARAADESRPQ